MKFLGGAVVGVFVRDEKRALYGTPIGVLSLTIENLFIKIDVVDVDGVVEADHDHLRHLGRVQFTRNSSTIGATVAVWQSTLLRIARWSPVRILIDG